MIVFTTGTSALARVKVLNILLLAKIIIIVSTINVVAQTSIGNSDNQWSGFYIGVQGSYVTGKNHWQQTAPFSQSIEGNMNGVLFGIVGGWNFQNNNLIYGVELDSSFGKADALSVNNPGPPSFLCGSAGCKTEISNFSTFRSRIGYTFGNTLPYFTAGVAVARARADAPRAIINLTDTVSGFVFGVGIEHAFSNHISGKIEYIHTDLGDFSIPTNCSINCTSPIEFGLLRAGLNYQF